MTRLTCAAVRRKLGAYHDGELTVDAQVSVQAHLSGCDRCSEQLGELAAIQGLVRRGVVTLDPWVEDANQVEHAKYATTLPATLATVVTQVVREKREDWFEQVEHMMLRASHVWISGGVLAVSVAGAVVLAAIFSVFTPTDPRSLAAVVDPGSNQNPVMVARGVTIPQVSLDSGLAVLLSGRLRLPLPNLALAAVVTREGEVSSLEVLTSRVSRDELPRDLFRLTSDIRFKPARYAGTPVAVNLVWLFEQTTVRPVPPPAHS